MSSFIQTIATNEASTSSCSNNNNNTNNDIVCTKKVILVIGACCFDYKIHVASYPIENTKCRSIIPDSNNNNSNNQKHNDNQNHQNNIQDTCVGGNAANVAITMSKILSCSHNTIPAKVFQCNQSKQIEVQYQIRLCSKIGTDIMGQQIQKELQEQTNVDISHSLFQMVDNTTTNRVDIIVTQQNNTRTCIYTPGTCGELSIHDAMNLIDDNIDQLLHNVIHIHTDGRHTQFAHHLIQLAKTKHQQQQQQQLSFPKITISIDHERDRHTMEYSCLLQQSDILFMNRLEQYNDVQLQLLQKRKQQQTYSTENLTDNDDDIYSIYKHCIVMLGELGAISILPQQKQLSIDSFSNNIDLPAAVRRRYSGILHHHNNNNNNSIVDTTGAGDTFIGSYLAYYLTICQNNESVHDKESYLYQLCLHFACWMSGYKIRGNGTLNLPSGLMIDQLLGTDHNTINISLCQQLTPFKG